MKYLKMERLWGAVLVLLAVFGLWVVDVSVIQISTTGVVTNGFWNVSALKAFHLGMFLSLGAMIGLGFLVIRRDG